MKKTSNGKSGGTLVGKPHYDKNGKPLGGIKAVVSDTNQAVELEGGEVIINKVASRKYWKELSRINQSAGGGVPIANPEEANDSDPEDFEKGGSVPDFSPNNVPSRMVFALAKKVKKSHPEIWTKAGNIYGNQAFENLSAVVDRGYWKESEEWMYMKWKSFCARHAHDFRLEGVVANLKWLNVVDKGLPYMRQIIEDAVIKTEKPKKQDKMAKGGGLSGYDARVAENLAQMSSSLDEWTAVPIIGFSEQEVNGKTKSMPLFDFPKGYKDAPSLYKNQAGGKTCCELCGKEPIAIIYWLQNDSKKITLRVGSECVGRFGEGNTGADNSRTAKIEMAKALDADMEHIVDMIKDKFSSMTVGKYGRKERSYHSLYAGDSEVFEGVSKPLNELLKSGALDALRNPKQLWDTNISMYWLIQKIPVFFYNEYETKLIPSGSVSRESADQQLLSWYTRNAKKCSEIIKAWKLICDVFVAADREQGWEFNPQSTPKAAQGAQLRAGAAAEYREHRKTLQGLEKGDFVAYSAARQIAKDHLKENKDYYRDLLQPHQKFELGGGVQIANSRFSLKTPNGQQSELSYMQQVLVRTQEFKNWFGDWEVSAKAYLNDGVGFKDAYQGVSKIINPRTFEPLLVHHGSQKETPFYVFDFNSVKPDGTIGNKLYAYFAYNFEYAELYSTSPYLAQPNSKPFVHSGFVRSKTPFMALKEEFLDVKRTAVGWHNMLIIELAAQHKVYAGSTGFSGDDEVAQFNELLKPFTEYMRSLSQIYGTAFQFWKILAKDQDAVFQKLLYTLGFDGVVYTENLPKDNYDINDRSLFTPAVAIFFPEQFKLGDGKNTTFNPSSVDIRYKQGGKIEKAEQDTELAQQYDDEDGIFPPFKAGKKQHVEYLIKKLQS